jgi:hypothetical protein
MITQNNKHMKTFLFLISMLLVTVTLSAGIEVSTINGTKKISISLNDLNSITKIELVDLQGIILTATKVKTPNYNSIFDLSTLPEGKYFLSIYLNNKEWVQPIVINKISLILDKKAIKEYFSPVFNVNGSKLDLVMLNQFLSPVEIQILNQNGQPVFNEKLGSVLKVEKRFDLSTLEPGNYTMVVSAHNRNYYQPIKQ